MVKQVIEVDLKWWTARQNNSGGSWYQNNDVDVYVSVQAPNWEEAEYKFENIVSGYSDYCPCCGERWYTDFQYEEGTDEPSYNDDLLSERTGVEWLGEKMGAVLYYYDGRKEHI